MNQTSSMPRSWLVLALFALGCTKAGQDAAENALDAEKGAQQEIVVRLSQHEYTLSLAEVAQGVSFEYEIIIPKDLDDVIPTPQDIGHASGPGACGLFPFEEITGNGQSYALRDVGLGPPQRFARRKIAAGKFAHSFEWDGRNWDGPSDTNNPKGELFPPGTYSIKVSVVGDFDRPGGAVPYEYFDTAKVLIKP